MDQDLVLPFSVGLLFFMHKIVIDKEKKYWLGFVAFALFLLQLHQATIFFLVPLTFFFIIKNRNFDIKYILWGLLIGLLPLIPYIIFEQSHKFQDFLLIFNAPNRVSYKNDFAVFLRPFQILNQGDFRYLFGDDIALFAQQFSLVYKLRVLFYFEYLVAFFGAIIFFKKHAIGRIFIYSSLCFVLLLFFLRIPADMHYFIVLMPILFLVTGIGLSYFWTKTKYGKIFSMILFSTFSLLSIVYIVSFFTFINHKGHLNGDYGTIYAVNAKTAQASLQQYVQTKEYQEILLARYVPIEFMSGSPTIASMLYNTNQTKNHLPDLERRLQQVPQDYRVVHELISYYNNPKPTRKTLQILREKAQTIPMYPEIYAITYNNFLNARLLKNYASDTFGFTFEYPQHWIVAEDQKAIILHGDGYIFSFTKNPPTYAKETTTTNQPTICNQKVTETLCADKQNNWCGTTYGSILNKRDHYFFDHSTRYECKKTE